MDYLLDVHTHTIASGHAYNSMMEMIHAAQEKKLEVYGITEHAPKMPGTCGEFYFHNLKVVPRKHGDLELLLGVELNILDEKGTVDMEEPHLGRMDVAIASLHTPCIKPGSREWNTECLIQAMKNPHINIIGHPDDGRYEVDYEALVQGAKEYGKILEVNNHSLVPNSFRQNARENDVKMLKFCMKYQVPVVMDSDAHFDTHIAEFDAARVLLEELDFPEELVVNHSVNALRGYINAIK